jgi:hypothetical protein
VSDPADYAARYRAFLGTQMMDPADVVLVTSDSVCTKVTRAVDSAAHTGPRSYAYVTVKFGDLYAAFNQKIPATHPSSGMMFVVSKDFIFQKVIGP